MMKRLTFLSAAGVLGLSVFMCGCSKKADVPATEEGRKSFMGDASKMPESARQKMREAQRNAGQRPAQAPSAGAPAAPAGGAAPAPPGP